MPDQTERDEIVRLTVVVSSLVTEVKSLSEKVDSLKDDHVFDLERQLAVLQSQNETVNDRLETIEGQFTWLIRTVIAEGLALVTGIITWAIQNYS